MDQSINNSFPPVLFIVGPTASGKTETAIGCAKILGAEVISADARQFFRGVNIGTAKPDAKQLAACPHHFIDHLDASEEYSAGRFFDEAIERMREIASRNKHIVVAGGSGLYVRVLLHGIFRSPRIPEDIRRNVREQYRENGLSSLQQELHALDPVYMEMVDPQNPVRLMRAIEVCRATGRPYSEIRVSALRHPPFRAFVAGIRLDRDRLYRRIDARTDAMIAGGLVDEVRMLLSRGVPGHAQAFRAVGYSEVLAYLAGTCEFDEMVRLIKQHTRNYAKRQMTWFRKESVTEWYPVEDEADVSSLPSKITEDYRAFKISLLSISTSTEVSP